MIKSFLICSRIFGVSEFECVKKSYKKIGNFIDVSDE